MKSASSFTSTDGEGIHNHLPEFQTYHVNGTMRAADRDNLMQEFRDAAKAVMSNAHCLTEGVDVPAVDMVAFLAPKRSRVDIVQATGRAMRTAPQKTTGYIFLPLYLQETTGESVEEAIDRTDFDEVWNVLQAMQEQDEVLADIIRAMRESQGRIGGFDDSRFRERVQILGPIVSLNRLRDAITTRCIERLAAFWDYMYGKLVAFKERFGHCNVVVKWEEDPQLGNWVRVQRDLQRHGRLSAERSQHLEALDFDWDPLAAAWEVLFARLAQFKGRFGQCDVPQKWPEDLQLAGWVVWQRQLSRRGRLRPERRHRLNTLGFNWDPLTAAWEEMFAHLVRYKERFGHCNVPADWVQDPRLRGWVGTQRQLRRHGRLTPDRIQRLQALGLPWNEIDAAWEDMFGRLAQYKELLGHCNVPQKWKDDPQLANWVGVQRALQKRGDLLAERRKRLDLLGILWDPLTATWEEMLGRIAQFKKQFGHCSVPDKWKDDPQLAHWVGSQRQRKRRSLLPSDRIQRLDALGFEWNPKRAAWEDMFNRLVRYRERTGDCLVPQQWSEDRQLAYWVGNQRQLERNGHLALDEIRRLSALGFEWNPRKALWEEMFGRLVQYKARFHDCNVPIDWEEDQQLARWVFTQRQLRKRGRLSPDRRQRLDVLNFEWEPHASDWEEMFKRLVRYKEHAGNCNVPQGWPANQQLARWVHKQRQLGQRGQLSPSRRQRLEALGFDWDPRAARWEKLFAGLVRYRERVGDCNVPRNWPEDPQLSRWVTRQRYLKQCGHLSADRIKRLDVLGFECDPWTALWEDMFARLVRYRERVGNCNVPRNWPEDRQLSHWVHTQRRFIRRGHLSADRVQRLAMLDFEWKPKRAPRKAAG